MWVPSGFFVLASLLAARQAICRLGPEPWPKTKSGTLGKNEKFLTWHLTVHRHRLRRRLVRLVGQAQASWPEIVPPMVPARIPPAAPTMAPPPASGHGADSGRDQGTASAQNDAAGHAAGHAADRPADQGPLRAAERLFDREQAERIGVAHRLVAGVGVLESGQPVGARVVDRVEQERIGPE